MELQAEAERRKRAQILESEGTSQAKINVAEARKQEQILGAEALQTEVVLVAEARKKEVVLAAEGPSLLRSPLANAIVARDSEVSRYRTGQAEALQKQAHALGGNRGSEAAALTVAREYVAAFRNIAQKGNTVLLPANAGDASSMVAQALSVYKNINATTSGGGWEPFLLSKVLKARGCNKINVLSPMLSAGSHSLQAARGLSIKAGKEIRVVTRTMVLPALRSAGSLRQRHSPRSRHPPATASASGSNDSGLLHFRGVVECCRVYVGSSI